MSARLWPLALVASLLGSEAPAFAQDMSNMPGMVGMPMKSKPASPAKKKPSAQHKAVATQKPMSPSPAGPDPATEHTSMPDTPGMVPPSTAPVATSPGDDIVMTGTALPAGTAPPPPVPSDHYADRAYPPAANADARALMMHQQGGQAFYQVLFNLAELQVRDGHDGYRWDGEAWFGGDINRVTLKSEGEGTLHEGVDSAEVQLLYSRAVGPYFNLQGGVRHDLAPTPTRTFVTVGVEGLAPYMFQTEARAFVATTGQVLGRLEGWYDQRLTQRFVLQPRVELNLAAQNDRPTGTGGGLVDAELGLRLRYEIAREFAPYVGVSYEAETGRTAAYARATGKSATTTSFVAGVRLWF